MKHSKRNKPSNIAWGFIITMVISTILMCVAISMMQQKPAPEGMVYAGKTTSTVNVYCGNVVISNPGGAGLSVVKEGVSIQPIGLSNGDMKIIDNELTLYFHEVKDGFTVFSNEVGCTTEVHK